MVGYIKSQISKNYPQANINILKMRTQMEKLLLFMNLKFKKPFLLQNIMQGKW